LMLRLESFLISKSKRYFVTWYSCWIGLDLAPVMHPASIFMHPKRINAILLTSFKMLAAWWPRAQPSSVKMVTTETRCMRWRRRVGDSTWQDDDKMCVAGGGSTWRVHGDEMHADDGDSTGKRRRLNRETAATRCVVTGVSSTWWQRHMRPVEDGDYDMRAWPLMHQATSRACSCRSSIMHLHRRESEQHVDQM
jgi:hypothetical protein